jgi:hypothetical protein
MIPGGVFALALSALASGAESRAWSCSAEDIHREVQTTRLVEVTRVEEIPKSVLEDLGLLEMGGLANPGESWNSGCVQDGKTPGAQLVAAHRSERLWLVVTLHGGFVVQQAVAVLCRDGSGKHRFRIESAARRGEDFSLAALRDSLRPESIERLADE